MTCTREAVLAEVVTWLGTPYEHLQRLKGPGGGTDCGQLLLGVYHAAGCIPHLTTAYYPRDFHLHRDREWYAELVSQFAREMTVPGEDILPADVVLYKVGRVFSHGGIVVEWPKIIHAFVRKGVEYADGTKMNYVRGSAVRFFRPRMFEG